MVAAGEFLRFAWHLPSVGVVTELFVVVHHLRTPAVVGSAGVLGPLCVLTVRRVVKKADA